MHTHSVAIAALVFLACSPSRTPEELCAAVGRVPNAARTACVCPMGAIPEDGGVGCVVTDGGGTPSPDSGPGCDPRTFYRDRDGDGFGSPSDPLDGCTPPPGYVANDRDCDDACEPCTPSGIEVCDGVRDEDCSGSVDEGCACVSGNRRACPGGSDVGECRAGEQVCSAGIWGTCASAVAPSAERCNGLDDDCNGAVDDGFASNDCARATGVEIAGCDFGTCVISRCAASLADCDGDFDNGCEVTLGVRTACRSCGDVCGWSACDSTQGCNPAVQVVAGGAHTCAARRRGVPVCWGRNSDGQVGDSTTSPRGAPVALASTLEFEAITLGFQHSCALLAGGFVACWGRNVDGQLGDGTNDRRVVPTQIASFSGVRSVAAGSHHTCAAMVDGTVRCWGANASGQLGDGTVNPRNRPVGVPITSVVDVASGGVFSCARTSDLSVWCWGDNSRRQLGDGTTQQRRSPVRVSGLGNVQVLRSGGAHSCVVTTDGGVACWGANMQGQLGAGTREEVVGVIRVDGLTNITDVALGSEHSCALDSDGFAYCWGSNSVGQLGIGRADEPTEPQRIDTGGTRFIGIEAGALHTCAVATNGAVFCWGFNEHGQLGTGLSGSFSPIVVAEP